MTALATFPVIRGRVAAVRGTVLEVDIDGAIPPLTTALECRLSDGASVTAVVQAHLGASRVRAIAIDSTRTLKRGARVYGDGLPLTVPVGRGLLGRVVDLHGHAIDGGPPIAADARRPLHRPPPPPGERRPWTEVYETGIKVIDLFCPFLRGGRAAVFGGAGVGKTVVLTEFIHNAVE